MLTQADCEEIYYALDTKLQMLLKNPRPDEIELGWRAHLATLMERIGEDGRQLAELLQRVGAHDKLLAS